MKKFICVIPRQKAGDLSNVRYQAQGNRALDYPGATRFPVIPLIWGYGQEGEDIRVIALSADYDNCRGNLELLEEELEALRKDRGLSCPKGVEVVEVPFDESLDSHIATFQKLIDRTEDGDDLYACLTFGSKPTPLVEVMAMQYAYRIHRDVTITCAVYGQMDHSVQPPAAKLYDITALITLDDIVRRLAEQRVSDPKAVLDRILNL